MGYAQGKPGIGVLPGRCGKDAAGIAAGHGAGYGEVCDGDVMGM